MSDNAPSLANRIPLQQWYSGWLTEHEKTNLIYAKPSEPQLHQVHFVRDTISFLAWRGVKYDDLPKVTFFDPRYYEGKERTEKDCVRVVGEHKSKSVRLPVFSIERPDLGVQIVMRYNFHDWNVSVRSEKPIEIDVPSFGSKVDYRERFPNGYERGSYWGYLYFQGFPDEYYFGPHEENPRRFSIDPHSDYELYAFMRALFRSLVP